MQVNGVLRLPGGLPEARNGLVSREDAKELGALETWAGRHLVLHGERHFHAEAPRFYGEALGSRHAPQSHVEL